MGLWKSGLCKISYDLRLLACRSAKTHFPLPREKRKRRKKKDKEENYYCKYEDREKLKQREHFPLRCALTQEVYFERKLNREAELN